MPLFVCDNCLCVENTAMGLFWNRNQDWIPLPYRGKALCSCCAPKQFEDGKLTEWGEWHGKFLRQNFEKYLIKFPNVEILNITVKNVVKNSIEKLKRYDANVCSGHAFKCEDREQMEEAPKGEWVKYEDLIKILEI